MFSFGIVGGIGVDIVGVDNMGSVGVGIVGVESGMESGDGVCDVLGRVRILDFLFDGGNFNIGIWVLSIGLGGGVRIGVVRIFDVGGFVFGGGGIGGGVIEGVVGGVIDSIGVVGFLGGDIEVVGGSGGVKIGFDGGVEVVVGI